MVTKTYDCKIKHQFNTVITQFLTLLLLLLFTEKWKNDDEKQIKTNKWRIN
jgi:hypothetical protein